MGVPKNFSKNIKLQKTSSNHDRRLELWEEGLNEGGTFVPKGVLYEDMDRDFIRLIEEELTFSIDGKTVPVFFLTSQRWSEFARTWQFTDKDRNVQMPFITIVRNPDVQFGTNPVTQYTIPGNRRHDYMKVPNFNGDSVGYDIYKIPQPIGVNLTYQVRFFSYRMREINKFNKIIMQSFQSRQKHIKCNGHYFPVILESIGDESTIDQFEKKRFYQQNFEMQLLGYIMDEEEYEVTPAITRVVQIAEVEPRIISGSGVDGFKPQSLILEEEIDLRWVSDGVSTGVVSTLNEVNNIVRFSNRIMVTDYSLLNIRDCSNISEYCTSISPKIYIDTGGGFVETSLPVQVNPNDGVYCELIVVDNTVDSVVTLRGYRN
tara:strand:- start:21265 stop:22386 length:1122 start_codon:yes stop_codon:yes gene_type:complete